nr:MAG TPA: hypothetical protein [Caudoviricetes sp.]
MKDFFSSSISLYSLCCLFAKNQACFKASLKEIRRYAFKT